jgi:Protein of unknown function (DUF2786)
VATILERVEHLMALATSPNEHEARNAALLAVQLIRRHKLVISQPMTRTKSDPGIARDPGATRRESPAPKRTRSSKNVKRVADPPEKIVAPLGGECVQCGGRYRADTTIFWFSAGGGMHVKCFEDWSKGAR